MTLAGEDRVSGRKGWRRKALMAAPFVPVVVALGVALAVRQWPQAGAAGKGAGMAEPMGVKAPEFVLVDAMQKEGAPPVQLSKLVQGGPVMIIFFPTYGCKKCVLYLESVGEHLTGLKEAGMGVVAICPTDAVALREELANMEPLPFPVLSDSQEDHGGDTARAFGMEDEGGMIPYGVFIVDRDRRVQFADKGEEPYDDFDALAEIGRKSRGKK